MNKQIKCRRSLPSYVLFFMLAAALCLPRPKLHAQQNRRHIDSLHVILNATPKDSVACDLLLSIAALFREERNADSALHYARRMYELATSLDNYTLQIKALNFTWQTHRFLDFNYQKSAEAQFEALKLAEGRHDSVVQAFVWESLGAIYDDLDDPDHSIFYAKKAYTLNKKLGRNTRAYVCGEGIGYVYALLNMPDSAYPYFHEAFSIGPNNPVDKDSVIFILASFGLGKVYAQWGKPDIAKPYFYKSLEYTTHKANSWYMGINYMGLGELYKTTGKRDSAIICYTRALATVDAPKLLPIIYRNLAELYEKTNEREAVKYWKLEALVRDSLYTTKKKIELQNMTFNEMERQNNIIATQQKMEEQKSAALKLQRQQTYTYAGLAGVVMLLLFSFFMVRNNKLLQKEKRLLSKEKQLSEDLRQRSDNLLLNILPVEVANELKEKGTAAARHFENVTVLFTDFVNFTGAGETMHPQALIDELHTCFKKFDEITGRFGIEKIKTIGDAYLAVCGLPTADPRNAENVVWAALEIRDYMVARKAQLGNNTFKIRLGIHSGSVVAGIVGVKKFAYDIWGDTVNTAARMEQHSEPGKINISQSTYELVKEHFTCTYRGEIDAKGKGQMKMYYVE